jgi:hypothetical protein
MEKDIGNEGTLRFELELVEGSRGLARGVPAKRTIESSDYNGHSDTAETYHTEDSETSADELALTSYPVEEPETSADEPVFTSFSPPLRMISRLMSSTIPDRYAKLAASKERLSKVSKRAISNDPRYGTGASSWRRQSKK